VTNVHTPACLPGFPAVGGGRPPPSA